MDTSADSATNLLNQKEKITAFLSESANPLSGASFPNIFIWQDFFDFTCLPIDGNLCIFATNEVGTFLYAPPLGKTVSPAAVQQCFSLMNDRNSGRPVSRIENVPTECLGNFDSFEQREKPPDYLYRRGDIGELKGNAYKTHRWAYNNFMENHHGEFLPYEDSLQEECMALYQRWAKERSERFEDAVYLQMLDDNELVHQRILRYHKELDLIGRVIKIKGQVVGYTFGFSLNEKTFCILCEIIDLSFKGAAVFIFREFCRDEALEKYEFINAMDDSDIPNIRRVKESFHPVNLIRNYVITPK